MASDPRATLRRPFWKRHWYNFSWLLLRLASMLFFRLRVTGQENVPKSGGVLLVANHQSFLDPPLVGCSCPRQAYFLARKTLFRSGFLLRFLHSYDVVPLDQEGTGVGGIKASLRVLKNGGVLVIFPEGARSADGEIAPFRPGFTTLATRSGAVILPAVIDGAFDAWPRSRKYPRLGRIHIHFGEPISRETIEMYRKDEHGLVSHVEATVRQLFDEVRA